MKKTILILVSAAVLTACSGKPVAQTSAATAQPAKPAAPAATANGLNGTVAETMNAGGYTYIRVGDTWAAVPQTEVKKGDAVTITTQMVAENFESKSLGRKFDKIIFGTMSGASQHMAAPAAPAQAPVEVKPVEKAPGGRTVADVWASKSGLGNKQVVVRGTVVKFLPEIMGKNWLHLRDGSGTRAKGDDDITVTTKDSAKVGDVITVTGTLRVDKDFGAGYQYPVIIEDAKISGQ